MPSEHAREESHLPSWAELAERAGVDPLAPALVALSGGADSVFLLRSLAHSRPRPHVFALHVDHGLRGAESGADAEFCRLLARELDVPFACERIELDAAGSDLERRARDERYRALARQARELDVQLVLTAHHADDALETLLMRWLRGTTLAGLAGLRSCAPLPSGRSAQRPPARDQPPQSQESRPPLQVVRPLLHLRSNDIRAILRAEGHSWREDSSNGSPRFTRNRIRHQLLPWIVEVAGPEAVRDLFAFHHAAAQLRDHLNESRSSLQAALEQAALEQEGLEQEMGERQLCLPRSAFLELPAARVRHDLWRCITERTGRAPGAEAIERILAALVGQQCGQWTLRAAWTLKLTRTTLELRPPGSAQAIGEARRPAASVGDFIPAKG